MIAWVLVLNSNERPANIECCHADMFNMANSGRGVSFMHPLLQFIASCTHNAIDQEYAVPVVTAAVETQRSLP